MLSIPCMVTMFPYMVSMLRISYACGIAVVRSLVAVVVGAALLLLIFSWNCRPWLWKAKVRLSKGKGKPNPHPDHNSTLNPVPLYAGYQCSVRNL